ncbi:hypothetical protein ACFWOT_27790 [Streptomyces sp. NPDC058440]|uniref:hypothetical protein n=1 Tax=Streptomyces sp. NPDC058440 TaxID=3346501 RepID=UPI0036632C90
MDEGDRLSLPRPRWSHYEIAIWGGTSEDDLAIAHGYLEVAETATRHWIARRSNDMLPISILYRRLTGGGATRVLALMPAQPVVTGRAGIPASCSFE